MKKKRKTNRKNIKNPALNIFIRYVLLIAVAFPNLFLFYKIFTPLTVYPLFALLSIFFHVTLISQTIILINRAIPIELIEACIAGAAYYLLFILNLSTPNIKFEKRVKALLLSFFIFLILNIIRIFILSVIAVSGSSFFGITHRLFWYTLSTVFVIAIWFYMVKLFKIKDIPFYSDVKFLYKAANRK